MAAPLSPVTAKLAEFGEDHRVVAAEIDGRVVGWAHVYLDRTLFGPTVAQLGGLAVDPEESGRGAGRALMGAVEEWAASRGCVAVWVRSGEQRTEAHDFYRVRGYRGLKRQLVLVKTLADDRFHSGSRGVR